MQLKNMIFSKYEGLCYPSHFLKSRGSGIRNTFLEYRTKQVNIFCVIHTLLATNKAKHTQWVICVLL